MFTTGPLANMP